MNMPYKTSRDYQLLKKLLDEGKEIVCFTDFPIDNRIFRDVCKARKTLIPQHYNLTLFISS